MDQENVDIFEKLIFTAENSMFQFFNVEIMLFLSMTSYALFWPSCQLYVTTKLELSCYQGGRGGGWIEFESQEM